MTNIDIVACIQASPVSSKSKATYINCLNTLCLKANMPLDKVIESPKEVSKIVSCFDSKHTQKTTYTAVLAALSRSGLKEQRPKLYSQWHELHDTVKKEIEEQVKRNEPTPRQQDAHVDWEAIIEARDKQAYGSKAHLLLCMLTMIPPRRQWDYANVAVYTAKPKTEDHNHIVFSNEGAYIHLTDYKTAKGGHTWRKELPRELVDVVRDSIMQNPRFKLFTMSKNETFTNVNSYTKWANNVIKRTLQNPKASVNTFRHSYQTYVQKKTLTFKEMEDIADDMGHSVIQSLCYSFKTGI